MKEILDVIHKTIYQFFDVCGDDEEMPLTDKDKLLLKVNKAICNNLKALGKEPKWIPVGKESPVAFDKVLVTYRLHYDDSIHIGIGNTTSNINGRYYWNINEQDLFGWDILAWMPLPEPYKAESEDKV